MKPSFFFALELNNYIFAQKDIREVMMEKQKIKRGRGQKPKYSPAHIIAKIDDYFEQCDKANRTYTMSGLALHIGYKSRQSLLQMEDDSRFKNFTEKEIADVREALTKAKLKIEAQQEELLLTAKNVAGVIFTLKNNFGWQDKTEVDANTIINLNVTGLD